MGNDAQQQQQSPCGNWDRACYQSTGWTAGYPPTTTQRILLMATLPHARMQQQLKLQEQPWMWFGQTLLQQQQLGANTGARAKLVVGVMVCMGSM